MRGKMNRRLTEKLWREEKYHVMFHSQKHYDAIRQAMRDQLSHNEITQLIQEALSFLPTEGSMRNACQHMWGYFRKHADTEEKMKYEILLQAKDFAALLMLIKNLAIKYNMKYLLESRVLDHGESCNT